MPLFLNPTGTFKARGISVALSKALELGVHAVGIPSAGNAGAALAAYAARAGVKAVIVVPEDTPRSIVREAEAYGAEIILVKGSISDAGLRLGELKQTVGLFDLSTFKEHYRIEGKKTMGFEIAEQLGWRMPDVIVYPTGGGTGLLGIWKGLGELVSAGVLEGDMPRMISVQSKGCKPIVEAFRRGLSRAEPYPNPRTIAAGIRVPAPYADYLILQVLRESGGTAVSVSDERILEAAKEMAVTEGVFPCPEGAATLAGLRELIDQGLVDRDENIVLINTGAGVKYMDTYAEAGMFSR